MWGNVFMGVTVMVGGETRVITEPVEMVASTQPTAEQRLVTEIERRVEKTDRPLPDPITYHLSATRSYEEAYWKDIAHLSQFANTVNSDVVQDEPTKKRIAHPHRDLHRLGGHDSGDHR